MTDGEWLAFLFMYALIGTWFAVLTTYALLYKSSDCELNRSKPAEALMFAFVIAATWPVAVSVVVYADMSQ